MPPTPTFPPPTGQWVWVPQGTPPPPPRKDRANQVGRIGLFVAGYFLLGLVWAAFGTVLTLLGVDAWGERPALVAVVAAGFAGAMLLAAGLARATEVEPLGVMAAFGSAAYVATAAWAVGESLGFDGSGRFWLVVLVSLPCSLAVLLWQPHPILGLNVAVAATAFVVAAPLGEDGTAVASGKAVLLALVLATLAVLVDLRTRSRAGSLLHYGAIAALVVAKLVLAAQLEGLEAVGVVAGLAVAELFLALLMRRRLWAVSGWITLVLAGVGATGAAAAEAVLGSVAGGLVAVPLALAAFTVQSRGEDARRTVLAALPARLAASFPP